MRLRPREWSSLGRFAERVPTCLTNRRLPKCRARGSRGTPRGCFSCFVLLSEDKRMQSRTAKPGTHLYSLSYLPAAPPSNDHVQINKHKTIRLPINEKDPLQNILQRALIYSTALTRHFSTNAGQSLLMSKNSRYPSTAPSVLSSKSSISVPRSSGAKYLRRRIDHIINDPSCPDSAISAARPYAKCKGIFLSRYRDNP